MPKRRILITGLSGAGKTTAARELSSMGFEAYDMESMPGLFAMFHKGTGEPFPDYDNEDPDKIRDADWRCDPAALRALFEAQREDTAFYCGVASDMRSFAALFDATIALSLSAEVHLKRLMTREGTGIMGGTEESRNAVIGWEQWWEGEMERLGARMLDASGSPREVAERILRIASDLPERAIDFKG